MIRAAKLQDIPQILSMVRACTADLIQHDIYQWNEQYPTEDIFCNDLINNTLWVYEYANEVVGTVVLSHIMDEEYKPISWNTPDTKNVYIHRLAVHPKLQGNGIAKALMDHAEEHALKLNSVSVRLDTFSKNIRNQKFYEARGYVKTGNVYFPNQSPHPFICYELILND